MSLTAWPQGVVFADDALIIFNKPPGLPSVPGRPLALHDCAASRLQACWPDALVVHRLDMATSGLLVFARGIQAQRRLSLAFAQREVDKVYEALVHGVLDDDAGQIELPLAADWPNRPLQRVDLAQGKPAQTAWRVLQRCPNRLLTRVELQPRTGRSHQLRVHLQAIGHPILGDALYGPQPVLPDRLMLHARSLAFEHPHHGERLTFNSQTPF